MNSPYYASPRNIHARAGAPLGLGLFCIEEDDDTADGHCVWPFSIVAARRRLFVPLGLTGLSGEGPSVTTL